MADGTGGADVVVAADGLTRLVAAIFGRGGSAEAEARMVAEHLVMANLMGHDSHGVGLVPTYVRHIHAGLLLPNTPAERLTDDGAILLYDGRRGFGRRVAGEAMAAAVARCRETGSCVLGLRGAHHIGRVGVYGEMAIAAGLVSVHFVNVVDHRATVVPFGGREPRYATNPVCVAVPGTETTPPIVLDMATSLAASGKMRVAMNKGERVPEGMILDVEGRPTTDPAVLFRDPRGAHRPFGGHKGSGLALVCEVLAGALTGGGTLQPGNPRHDSIINNMLAFLVDPARLVDSGWLAAEIDAVVDYVKSAAPADPDRPVMVAGDPERARRIERAARGIPIDATTWDEILAAGESLGLARDAAVAIVG